jgi:hypothetical protein
VIEEPNPYNPKYRIQSHGYEAYAKDLRAWGDSLKARVAELERDKEILGERIREVEVKWQRTDDALVRYGVALARIVERHTEGTLFPQTAANIAAEALK